MSIALCMSMSMAMSMAMFMSMFMPIRGSTQLKFGERGAAQTLKP